jgi:hypothetical protein
MTKEGMKLKRLEQDVDLCDQLMSVCVCVCVCVCVPVLRAEVFHS